MENKQVNAVAIPLLAAWTMGSVGYMTARFIMSGSYNVYSKPEVRAFLLGNTMYNVLLSSIWSDNGPIKTKGTMMQIFLFIISDCNKFMALSQNMVVVKPCMQFVIAVNVLANVITAIRAHICDYGWLASNVLPTLSNPPNPPNSAFCSGPKMTFDTEQHWNGLAYVLSPRLQARGLCVCDGHFVGQSMHRI